MSKLFQYPHWSKKTKTKQCRSDRQVNIIPVREEQPLISRDAEVSVWPEKWAPLEKSHVLTEWISSSEWVRCGPTVTCFQRGRLVLGQTPMRCYDSKLAHALRGGVGGVEGDLSMGTYVILPLWRTISWTPVREGHKQTWGRQNKTKKEGRKQTWYRWYV